MSRVLTSLVAAVTATLLALTAAPATADQSDRALPEREITIDIQQTDATTNGVKVKILGTATDWANKKVTLQKKQSGNWKAIANKKTNDKGKYVFKEFLKRGTHKFRVKTKKGGGYKTSYSPIAGGTVS
jgi:5-hydroxyisourate hydrolase-like protein (transthyretin family)